MHEQPAGRISFLPSKRRRLFIIQTRGAREKCIAGWPALRGMNNYFRDLLAFFAGRLRGCRSYVLGNNERERGDGLRAGCAGGKLAPALLVKLLVWGWFIRQKRWQVLGKFVEKIRLIGV